MGPNGEGAQALKSLMVQNTSSESRKLPSTEPTATRCTLARPMILPSTPQVSAPSSGSAMISHSACPACCGFTGAVWKKVVICDIGSGPLGASVLHRLDVVDVDAAPAAEDGDDDGQAHRRLGGGHRDDEEGADVPGEVAQLAREGE